MQDENISFDFSFPNLYRLGKYLICENIFYFYFFKCAWFLYKYSFYFHWKIIIIGWFITIMMIEIIEILDNDFDTTMKLMLIIVINDKCE